MFVYTLDDVGDMIKGFLIFVFVGFVLSVLAHACGVPFTHVLKLFGLFLLWGFITLALSAVPIIETAIMIFVLLCACNYYLDVHMHVLFWILTYCALLAVLEYITMKISLVFIPKTIAGGVINIILVKKYFLDQMSDMVWIIFFFILFVAINIVFRVTYASAILANDNVSGNFLGVFSKLQSLPTKKTSGINGRPKASASTTQYKSNTHYSSGTEKREKFYDTKHYVGFIQDGSEYFYGKDGYYYLKKNNSIYKYRDEWCTVTNNYGYWHLCDYEPEREDPTSSQSHEQCNKTEETQKYDKDSNSFDFFAGCTDLSSVEKKYHQLSKIYHPDSDAGDKEAMIKINAAYEKKKAMFA